MRWEDERYVRVYTRDTTDWLALSFEAQALMLLVLRKVDRAGLMKLGRHGKRGVAVAIGHPQEWTRLEPALEELLVDGCVVLTGDGQQLLVPNFLVAQEASSSDKARQQKFRELARDLAAAKVTGRDEESHGVTERHEPSQPVTGGHAASHAVTPSCAVPCPAEPYSSLSGSEPRPPVSHTSAELLRELDELEPHLPSLLAAGPVDDLPDATDHAELEPNPSGSPNGSNHPVKPESSPQLALVAPEEAQEPRQRTKPTGPMPEDLQALWNELGPPKGLQRWERMSDSRKRVAVLHLAAVPDLGRWRAWLTAELARGWNLGQNDTGWRADVEWLLRAKTRDLVADFNPAAAPAPKADAKPTKWMVL